MSSSIQNPESGHGWSFASSNRPIIPDRRSRGAVLIYACLSLAALTGLASLAIDVAHARLVKRQLQVAADAAARYGAAGLTVDSSTAFSNAASAAALNNADGTSVVLNSSTDVQFGTWDSGTQTFTATGSAAGATAIRVYARRTVATGNPVSLSFGSLFGKSSADVTAYAIATIRPGGYGVVGIKSISLSGGATDSYWAPSGYTAGGSHGSISSNGNITLTGSAQIDGDAHPGPGHSVNNPGAVTGSTTPLAQAMNYSNASPTDYAGSNNDGVVPNKYMSSGSLKLSSSQSLTLPGGTYYFNSISTSGSSSLSFSGPATVYVYGSISLSGTTTTSSSLPGNLKIIVGPDTSGNAPGDITLSGGSSLYASIYAPQSNITVSGGGSIYGSLTGLTVTSTGNSNIHYDQSLSGPGNISMAQ